MAIQVTRIGEDGSRMVFDSVKKAAMSIKVPRTTFMRNIRNRVLEFGGFEWELSSEAEDMDAEDEEDHHVPSIREKGGPSSPEVNELLKTLVDDTGKFITEFRASDGYANATLMCKNAGMLTTSHNPWSSMQSIS